MMRTTKIKNDPLMLSMFCMVISILGCSSEPQHRRGGDGTGGHDEVGSEEADSELNSASSYAVTSGMNSGSDSEFVTASWMDVFNKLKSATVNLPASYRHEGHLFRAIRSGESGYDYITAALRQLKTKSKIRIPTGHYEIRLPPGSNAHAFFTVARKQDKVIDFSHSTLSFYEPKTVFHLEQCERVALQNVRIVHRYPLVSLGWLDHKANHVKLKVTTQYRNKLKNLPSAFHKISTIYQAHENSLISPVPHIWRKNGSSYRLVDTDLIAAGVQGYNATGGTFTVDQSHPLRANLERLGPDGTPLLIKHYTYGANAVSANGGRDLTFEGMKIHGVPGMAFYVANVASGVLVRNNIVRANKVEDATAILGATADGVHLSAVRSNIIISDNQLSDLGDDAINVYHGHFFEVESGDGLSMVVRRLGVGAPISLTSGSSATLYRNNLIVKKAGMTVRSVVELPRSSAGQQRFEIQHRSGYSNYSPFADFVAIEPASGVGGVFIANNRIDNSTARGILAQAKNVMIKSNVIENTARSAIKITSDTRWFFEVGLPTNIKVYSNTIRNAAWDYLDNEAWTTSPGAITLITEIDPATRGDRKPYGMTGTIQDISILNNQVSDTPISLTHFGVRGLRIYSNSFANDSDYLTRIRPGSGHGWFMTDRVFGENAANCAANLATYCGN